MELFKVIVEVLLFLFMLFLCYCIGYSRCENECEIDRLEHIKTVIELEEANKTIKRLEKEHSFEKIKKEKLDEVEQLAELFNYQGIRKDEHK